MEVIIGHVREGNLAETRAWLENTENDVNQGDEHRFSLLHWAAREGQTAIVDLLITRGGARVNATNLGDDTALHLAAAHGHIDVVHYLLMNYRISIDAANEHGNTALHYACFWNHLEIAEFLVKNGACLMQENKYGTTPLEIARPRARSLLEPFAQSLGMEFIRQPFRDASWIGTKVRARDATIFKLDGDAWDPRDVELTGALADGHGAEVLRGFFRRNEVVVKMLKLGHYTSRQARDFKDEFPRLRIFNHPNILPVLAIFNATPRLCLISEYMKMGSLFYNLHPDLQHHAENDENTNQSYPIEISNRQALRFALDIAKAMDFLHSPELKVPNFRLNSKHILIDEDIAKIGSPPVITEAVGANGQPILVNTGDEQELLTARLDMADYKFSFHEKAREFNPAWMSPEALQKKPNDINLQASDMWSFGVVLWELITRLEPFGGLEPMVIGMQIATDGLRLPHVSKMDNRMTRLLDLCMNEDPGKRPQFDMLLPLLDKMRERTGHDLLQTQMVA